MGENLRVRLGDETVPQALELGAEGRVVGDDAVVHHGEIAVAAEMRVGVLQRNAAVRRPAGVGDADVAMGGGEVPARRHFAHGADALAHLDAVRVDRGQPAGVVAAVFQAGDAFYETRGDFVRPAAAAVSTP